jgi:hypothetical protein
MAHHLEVDAHREAGTFTEPFDEEFHQCLQVTFSRLRCLLDHRLVELGRPPVVDDIDHPGDRRRQLRYRLDTPNLARGRQRQIETRSESRQTLAPPSTDHRIQFFTAECGVGPLVAHAVLECDTNGVSPEQSNHFVDTEVVVGENISAPIRDRERSPGAQAGVGTNRFGSEIGKARTPTRSFQVDVARIGDRASIIGHHRRPAATACKEQRQPQSNAAHTEVPVHRHDGILANALGSKGCGTNPSENFV